MARRYTVTVPDETAAEIEALAEQITYQVPTLISVLLRDALAGRRSALLPKGGAASATRPPSPAAAAEGGQGDTPAVRWIELQHPATCAGCKSELPAKTPSLWDRAKGQALCKARCEAKAPAFLKGELVA